jgi:hypothetical protein
MATITFRSGCAMRETRKKPYPAAPCAYCCLVWIALAWPFLAEASHIVYESLEQVIARTDSAMQVEIIDMYEQRDSAMWRTLKLKLRPLQTVFGDAKVEQASRKRNIVCLYQEGLPHRRGETMVSPLVSGSGLEFDLHAGERVVLLIEGNVTKVKTCRVLRIEPLSELDQIVKLKKQ